MKSKLLVFLVAGLACGSAAAAKVDVERLRAVISDTPDAVAPGCAVGVFRAGKVEALTAVGYADLEEKRPLDADTLFYAASVSKQFTVLAIAKLVEAGRLGLDDDVRRYLPELPQYERPVTVRMLILHTAGIRDSLGLLQMAGLGTADKNDKDTALQLVFRQKQTNFTPGTEYSYSNGGYLLLAEIVERIGGVPFADFAKRELLDPMGMKRSFFLNGPPPAMRNAAHGYVKAKDGEGYEIRDTYPRFSGSGGLMLTLDDLARYEHDIEVGHKVWTPVVRRIMLTPGDFSNGEPAVRPGSGGLGYGGGLQIGWHQGQYVVQHGGGAEAFRHLVARLPERRLGVAVLCNRVDWPVESKLYRVVEAVEGDIFHAPVEDAQVSGRYHSDELQASYDLSLKDDTLTLRVVPRGGAEAGEPLQFKRERNGTFKLRDMVLTVYEQGTGFNLDSSRISRLQFRKVGDGAD